MAILDVIFHLTCSPVYTRWNVPYKLYFDIR